MNTTHYDLVEHNHIMADSAQKQKDEYYNSFVVLDSCRAIVAHFEDFNEACSWARTEARQAKMYHRTLTLEVYGCDSEGYSTDENDSTLVYSTDKDVNYMINNNDYKTIRKAIARLNYLSREIEHYGGIKAISGLLARVSYRLDDILADAEKGPVPYKPYIKEEFDYVCAWYDYLVKASLPEAEYLEQARIELRNALNNLNYDK